MAANKLRTIVTGGETWFTLESQHSAKWSVHREEGPERARQQLSTKKFIVTLFVYNTRGSKPECNAETDNKN
jgi:hypothetical protein